MLNAHWSSGLMFCYLCSVMYLTGFRIFPPISKRRNGKEEFRLIKFLYALSIMR